MDLTSSAWNRQKQTHCPLQGVTLLQRLTSSNLSLDVDVDKEILKTEQNDVTTTITTKDGKNPRYPIHLLQKQFIPTRKLQQQLQQRAEDPSFTSPSRRPKLLQQQPMSELERAVLLDCLSHHLLLFSQQNDDVHENEKNDGDNFFLANFEKVSFRKNEIVFRRGTPAEYLYILFRGDVDIISLDSCDKTAIEDQNNKYTVFGELELMTRSPYKATVKATSQPCVFFRLSASTVDYYRKQLQHQVSSEERLVLLQQALPDEVSAYFQDDVSVLRRLVSCMKRRTFQKGEILVHKQNQNLNAVVIVFEGLVVATDITAGGRSYQDLGIGPGRSRISFGWQSVMTLPKTNVQATDNTGNNVDDSIPVIMTGTITALSHGQALVIPKKAFEDAFQYHYSHDKSSFPNTTTTLLDVRQRLADLRMQREQLQQIAIFKDSHITKLQIQELMDLMHHCEFTKDEIIFRVSQKVEAAMYFVRQGSIRIESNKGKDFQVIHAGGYFGEQNMLLDQNKPGVKHYQKRSLVTATCISETAKLDVLYLEECRNVINTTTIGYGSTNSAVLANNVNFPMSKIRRHALLGTGSFGQVWLASIPPNVNGVTEQQVFALKVQPKSELLLAENIERVVAERNVLASLNSPFVVGLHYACQDDQRLYTVTTLLQGGELESLIPEDGLSESDAKFYAAGILEGLTHMHRKHIIHRDVKSTNVLLNNKGYPCLIDLGFSKYVPDKTFTFCGSPMLTAPEIILYKGHDKSADHWSWAVTVYHIVTGRYPFYKDGMDELALYKNICMGSFEVNGCMSVELRLLMVAVLYPDPSERLGSRAKGWHDIFASPWFSNDPTFDHARLRMQTLPAPWVPPVKDALDPSRFHSDFSSVEDLVNDANCLQIMSEQQDIYASFGPMIDSVGMRVYS
jgi:serine/threonine protein kinase/CRP-like cAMP-binding protein